MSKKKMIWTLAIALIAALMIPLANAQAVSFYGYGVSNLKVFLVNAGVIFLVLFLLQAMLVPGKEGKEQTSMWFIIVIASLVISYLYGSAGYVWKVGPLALIFNKYVLVNAAIIGIILYLISGFVDLKGKLHQKEGHIGLALIIIVISLLLAVKWIGPYWIWSAPSMDKLKGFLFVVDKNHYGGILNPFPPDYKLWIFATLFMVIAFFFNNFLIKDSKNNKLNYGLALILAGQMAYNGITIDNVILICEILFVLILQESLKNSITTHAWLRWLVAIGLVWWAGSAVTQATGYGPGLGATKTAAGQAAYGVGWLIKAGIVIGVGIIVYFALNRWLPGSIGATGAAHPPAHAPPAAPAVPAPAPAPVPPVPPVPPGGVP